MRKAKWLQQMFVCIPWAMCAQRQSVVYSIQCEKIFFTKDLVFVLLWHEGNGGLVCDEFFFAYYCRFGFGSTTGEYLHSSLQCT